MTEIDLSALPELRDPVLKKALVYLAKNHYASPLKLSYELKLDEVQVSDALKKLEGAGLVERQGEQSQVTRSQYMLTDLGLKLRPYLLKMETAQRGW